MRLGICFLFWDFTIDAVRRDSVGGGCAPSRRVPLRQSKCRLVSAHPASTARIRDILGGELGKEEEARRAARSLPVGQVARVRRVYAAPTHARRHGQGPRGP